MGIRVLVFDDDPAIRVTLARWLQADPDLQLVGEAARGEEAVAMALAIPADVIVMDVHMPGLDGIEAARRIRAGGVRAPILVVSADGSAGHEAGKVTGARFLVKGKVGFRGILDQMKDMTQEGQGAESGE